jgi:acyl-CoA thioesterase II
VWFHHVLPLDGWVLLDLVPHRVAGGRGWYTGAVHSVDGVHGASLAQEVLFRRASPCGRRPAERITRAHSDR